MPKTRLARSYLPAAVCAVMLVSTTPHKAVAASMVEYIINIQALIITVIASFPIPIPRQATDTVIGQLVTAVDNAALASEAEDQPREIAWIGRASGATSALIGFTASCDDDNCEVVRDAGQEILGLLARRKAALVGGSCGNGVIESFEQCDPHAAPTGCETTTAPSFCSTQCLCVPLSGTP